MANKIIKNYDEFTKFCKKQYDALRRNDFKTFSVIYIALDSDFIEFNKLNDYLYRFENYKGENDTAGEKHKKFLSCIKISVNLFITDFNDYDIINQFLNDWKQVVNSCQIVFRFKVQFDNVNDFNLIKHFEEKYAAQLNGIIKYTFVTQDLKVLEKTGWRGYEIDEKGKDFNFSTLTNLLLSCVKQNRHDPNYKVYIEIKNCDERRIPTYVSSIINERLWVLCNGKVVLPNSIENFGALPPAVFVTKDNLHILQQPLHKEVWKQIKEQNYNFDKQHIGYEEFKSYLKICYRYLFEDFDGNKSANYTKLRGYAYGSDEFTKYLTNIPFLALLIFAMYDNSYRNDLLLQAKGSDYYNTYKLEKSDFLLEKQGEQEYKRYEKYKAKRNYINVKNLLNYVDEIGGNSVLHQTVVSEIFECVSIAEGLLQILENAAWHAGGGLLSMRIYSRATQLTTGKDKKEKHVEYLNREYSPDYFELEGIKGTNYFLEVQISDLFDKSIPEKFIEDCTKNDGEIKNIIEGNKNNIDLKYFFDSSDKKEQIEIKKKFFNCDNRNFVFHYGLEIFRTLVTARKGIFAVSGYNENYQNFETFYDKILSKKKVLVGEFSESFPSSYDELAGKLRAEAKKNRKDVIDNITRNKRIRGTTYRMLLPLNHNTSSNLRVINNEIEISLDDSYIGNLSVCSVNVNDLRNIIDEGTQNKSEQQEKEKRIKDISDKLEKDYTEFIENNASDDKKIKKQFVFCLNFSSDDIFERFEETIKGSVLFVLKELEKSSDCILPVALVNLTPFQLIEAARILAVYYSNNEIAQKSSFERFQFYLKSTDGKDLIFAGNNIEEVRGRLLKTAMANGTMNNDLMVIDKLLRRMR